MIFHRSLFQSEEPRTVYGAYGPVDEYASDEFELAALVSLEANSVQLLACRVTRAGEELASACHVDDAVAAIGRDEIERVFLELAGDSERGDIVEVYGDCEAEDAAVLRCKLAEAREAFERAGQAYTTAAHQFGHHDERTLELSHAYAIASDAYGDASEAVYS